MISSERLEILNYWISERAKILDQRNEGKPKPWTKDPILQSYRFCNVKRENDKVTRWFATNWRNEEYWDHKNFVPAIILGRTINWPDTLEEIGFPFNWDRGMYLKKLNDRQKRGEKVYTGAYMITAGPPGITKNEWVTGNAETYFKNSPQIKASTLEDAWVLLQQYPCVGPFIAGQIVADLKQTKVLEHAPDWWMWAALGPGSTRGLNRLHMRPVKTHISQEQGLIEMREVRRVAELSYLCLQDVQNCLCEFDKYMRVKLGEGKPRASYPGV